jgi:uncharacterized transporter YbjL
MTFGCVSCWREGSRGGAFTFESLNGKHFARAIATLSSGLAISQVEILKCLVASRVLLKIDYAHMFAKLAQGGQAGCSNQLIRPCSNLDHDSN